jgi:formate transporter
MVAMHNLEARQQPPTSADPFLPREVASRIEAANVQRAALPLRSLVVLGLLGGLYIAFGGALATLVLTDSSLGYGLGRLAAGLAFSLGLIMLVVAGGELFTGNNLMLVALASRKIAGRALLRNWAFAYATNAAGAMLLAFAIHLSGVLDGNAVKATAIKIAETKAQLGTGAAFLRGVLCNVLVCLAVWLSVAARSVEGKAIAIAFPIGAFVALGFEHCIANFYLMPVGMLSGAHVTAGDFLANIIPVTLGNTLGGTLVAGAYYLVYLGSAQPQDRHPANEPVTPSRPFWRVSPSAGWPAIADPGAAALEPARPPVAPSKCTSKRSSQRLSSESSHL